MKTIREQIEKAVYSGSTYPKERDAYFDQIVKHVLYDLSLSGPVGDLRIRLSSIGELVTAAQGVIDWADQQGEPFSTALDRLVYALSSATCEKEVL